MNVNHTLKVSLPYLSEFECRIDKDNHPSVIYHKEEHSYLSSLLRAAPWLLEAKNLKALASVANFFFKDIEFDFIEDIENFKKTYQELINTPPSKRNPLPFQLIDFGVFDVSSMCDPYFDQNTFIFYVKNNYNLLPYRVICSSLTQETPDVSYELLPRL